MMQIQKSLYWASETRRWQHRGKTMGFSFGLLNILDLQLSGVWWAKSQPSKECLSSKYSKRWGWVEYWSTIFFFFLLFKMGKTSFCCRAACSVLLHSVPPCPTVIRLLRECDLNAREQLVGVHLHTHRQNDRLELFRCRCRFVGTVKLLGAEC